MTTEITMRPVPVAQGLPDADAEVLIWRAGSPHSEVGALAWVTDDGTAEWIDTDGCQVHGVTHWAEMPCLPA